MASRKPIKRTGPKALVQRLLHKGQVIFSQHCHDQMKARKIAQPEIFRVLRSGKREPKKDQLQGDHFTYAFRGYDHANERSIRVIVAIRDDDLAVIVTVIDLDV